MLLAIAFLLAQDANAGARVQFCWAMGKSDNTMYYAEAENREDRKTSFDMLLEISGIDHQPVQCHNSDPTSHHLARAKFFREWLASECEIVDTTFLSDRDY
jgi:hypothetical protein